MGKPLGWIIQGSASPGVLRAFGMFPQLRPHTVFVGSLIFFFFFAGVLLLADTNIGKYFISRQCLKIPRSRLARWCGCSEHHPPHTKRLWV